MRTFVARQPILDRNKAIYAYELLFRSALANYFRCDQPTGASSKIIVDGFFLLGMQTLTCGGKAFINTTKEVLLGQYATLLPKEQTVVQILETVEPDEKVIASCKALKQRGYLIALDDFVDRERLEPFTQVADFIKVDFQTNPDWIRRQLARQYTSRGIRMVADKVETPEQFQEALSMGYDYFQGYFFCKPEVLSGSDIPSYRPNYCLLLQEINREEPDMVRIEEILKQEASLCYKLLRYLNSSMFGFAGEIKSIRHAVSLLGLVELRKWTSLVVLACLSDKKPRELLVSSVLRAKFCENLAVRSGLENRSGELFLMGLLSMLDAILERPLAEILGEVPVSGEVKAALLHGVNLFRYIYELVLAYERGNWRRASQFASSLRMNEMAVTEAYLEAAKWGLRIFQFDSAS